MKILKSDVSSPKFNLSVIVTPVYIALSWKNNSRTDAVVIIDVYNMKHILLDGYAFSQEEGGSVSQTEVIRAYDSNAPKPSGN